MAVKPVYKNKKAPCFSQDHLGQGGCPAINDIPGFLYAVSQKQYRLAFDILKKTNPFSGGCGRFCDHPCETACNRDKFDDSVNIRDLERFISQFGFEQGLLPSQVTSHLKKKVAIIGGGPAGLSAAYFLKKEGFSVHVFDKAPQMGGLMAQGIPIFRYPTEIMRWEIDYVKALGVEMFPNTDIDTEKFNKLRQEYDYVVVASGTHKARRLRVQGEELDQVFVGLDFLKTFNNNEEFREKGLQSTIAQDFINGKKMGKEVAVVGGGYTAIDVARMAARLGKKVTVFYRRGKEDMSIHDGEVEECEKEGIKFRFFLNPQNISATADKRLEFVVEKMRAGEMEASGKSGIYASGEFETLRFDAILKAIGETPELNFLPEKHKIQESRLFFSDEVATEQANPESLAKVFIAGDARYGYAADVGMVVRAIGSGRKTADEMIADMQGAAPVRYQEEEIAFYQSIKKHYFKPKARARQKTLKTQERVQGFSELIFTLSEEEAIYAASRCFYCGICVTCDWCFHYSRGAIVKAQTAWDGKRSTRYFRFIDDKVSVATGASVAACPRNAMGFAPEQQFTDPRKDYKQQYIFLPAPTGQSSAAVASSPISSSPASSKEVLS